ncbi:zinc finger protein 43 isoform X2 [Aplysia californica]|uniref:Zinc finger protein 43 isoform X2 n=1 Tax=Aplysia californica TaxID=6500 RepID=A0ABM1A2W0_APLCA|nr:zinc finger protein 43 isoform X2 [Aplysia californica]
MADISYTSKQMDANCEEDTTITMYRLNSGNDNGSGCVKTCDLFVPCSSGEGVNLGIDSIVVKSELTSSSGTRSRSSTSTGTLCTNSLREDVKKHDIIIVIGRESESVGVDEEHLSVKEEPSFECLCDVKAETNDKLNVESESSLTLRHSVVKDEPICTEEEDVKPVIKPECLTDICTVKTEPLFGHFPDFGDEVRPKVENFVKEEVSEWEGPDFGEVGKTEGQVGDVEDTCAEPVFVEDHMSQAGGLQLKISNVRSLCMEQSASPDTDVVASSSPTSTFSSDPVTSSGSVVRASWDHGESSDVSTSPHWPLTSGHPVQQTSDMQRRQGQSSSCRFQTGQRVYEENVGSVRKETSSGDIGAVERVCDLHQNIAGDKQMDNRNLYHGREKPHECKVCGEMFSEVGNLQTHEKNHTRDRPHQSEVCGAAFTKSRHLQDHKGTHTRERPYKCEVCGATFTRCRSLQDHKRTHTGEKPYECEVCGATFKQSGHLQSHKRIHTGEKPYKCEVCRATFTQGISLQRHKRTHTGEKPYKCEVCGATFTRGSSLQDHKRIHTGEKPYKCEVCGATFAHGSCLFRHKRTHSTKTHYQCEVCGVTFASSSSLHKHKRIHTREKPYKCEVCGATFTSGNSLHDHKRIHSGEKPYKCEVCGATFTLSSNLQSHKRIHKGEKPKCELSGDIGAVERVCDLHQNIAGDKQMDNRNLYEECDMSLNDCAFASEAKADDIGVESDVCKIVSQTGPGNRLNVSSKHESGGKSRMSCDSKQSMGQGPDFNLSCAKSFASCMNSTESSSTTPPKVYKEMGAGCQVVPRSLVRESRYSGEQPHKCNVCLEMFTELGDLQRHKRTYTIDRPCKCEVCGVTFTCSSSLHKHKRIHSGEKSYKCEVCGATFAYGSDLQRHKRIHSGKKRYQCEVCGVTFASSSNLQKHKRIHRGEKPYKCEVCGATFTQNGNLQSHKRIHTGEKPYKCEVCGATFTFSSNLRNHKRIHTREKLYKCDICGVGFTESGNLQTHKRIHTGEKPYKCEVCGATFTLSSNLQSHERIHTGEKA